MNASPPVAVVEILIVEDNPGDVRLAREGLSACKIRNNLHAVDDGVKAMAFLRKQGEYARTPRPDLILLDLNLPKKDGREVLREIKADADLCRIPIVVLTTSKADTDVASIYELGANSFISKPVRFEALVGVMRILGQYWFNTVQLPAFG